MQLDPMIWTCPFFSNAFIFLSVAMKDRDVVQWLVHIGLGFSQVALLRHLLSETGEERQVWEMVRDSGPLRKIALAAFLKVLLPVEALAATQTYEARSLKKEWDEAYAWLGEKEREGLSPVKRGVQRPLASAGDR
jgi:hypothetical protein